MSEKKGINRNTASQLEMHIGLLANDPKNAYWYGRCLGAVTVLATQDVLTEQQRQALSNLIEGIHAARHPRDFGAAFNATRQILEG